jgi:hypothetical protein
MSTLGTQEVLSDDHTRESWELIGRDMIRTRDGRMIVAQFWTSPSKADAALMAAGPDLIAALREIETICTEDASDCRKRMGTRVGNCIATVRAALAKAGA